MRSRPHQNFDFEIRHVIDLGLILESVLAPFWIGFELWEELGAILEAYLVTFDKPVLKPLARVFFEAQRSLPGEGGNGDPPSVAVRSEGSREEDKRRRARISDAWLTPRGRRIFKSPRI